MSEDSGTHPHYNWDEPDGMTESHTRTEDAIMDAANGDDRRDYEAQKAADDGEAALDAMFDGNPVEQIPSIRPGSPVMVEGVEVGVVAPVSWEGTVGIALNALMMRADEHQGEYLRRIQDAVLVGVQAEAEHRESLLAMEEHATNAIDSARRAEDLLRREAQKAEANMIRADNAERAMRDFRAKVRKEAIKAAKDQDWCTEGLNEVLERLGLDKYQPEWKVSGTIKYAERSVSWTVKADTAEDAERLLKEELEEDPEHSAFDDGLTIERVDFETEDD